MLRKFAAFMLAFVLALSAVSCGKQADGDGSSAGETVSSETEETAAKSTKKKSSDSDSKKETTTSKKKKKTTTKESTADKDSSKETKTTKKTTASAKKTTTDVITEIEVTEEDTLGWTKEIADKYQSASSPEEFLKSLTFEEFLIVVKTPEDTARMQYNALHGIATPIESEVSETSVNTAASTYSVTVVTEDPGVKIDMTEDSALKSVYDKFGVTIDDLLAITGLSKEEFFYVWNVKKDSSFRNDILNQLYGYNYYESGSTDHPVVPDKVDMKLLKAYWDNLGKLHMICSINNGCGRLAYNIEITNFEARDKFDRVIAKKNFGLITKYVDINDSENDDDIEGIAYNRPVLHEFVFESGKVSKPYANIRDSAGVKITYRCNCDVLN